MRAAETRGYVPCYPWHRGVFRKALLIAYYPTRQVRGWPRFPARVDQVPHAPASLVLLAEELRQDGVDPPTRRVHLVAAVSRWRALPESEQRRRDRLALAALDAGTSAEGGGVREGGGHQP